MCRLKTALSALTRGPKRPGEPNRSTEAHHRVVKRAMLDFHGGNLDGVETKRNVGTSRRIGVGGIRWSYASGVDSMHRLARWVERDSSDEAPIRR